MRITLNLASRPFADLGPAIKRLRNGMAVLAVVAIGLGLGLHAIHHKADQARARDHSLDGAIAHITQERQGYQDMMRQPPNAKVLVQAEALNKLFEQKAFSWTLAMEDLETVMPGGVMVSSLEPIRAKDGHITLHLRVIGPRDRAVEMVSNLEHSKRFLMPRIVGENSEAPSGPNQRLEPVSASNRFDFDLLAEYNPAPPGEHRTEATLSPAVETPASVPAPVNVARPLPAPVASTAPPPIRPSYTSPPPPPPSETDSSPGEFLGARRLGPVHRHGRNRSNGSDESPGGPQ